MPRNSPAGGDRIFFVLSQTHFFPILASCFSSLSTHLLTNTKGHAPIRRMYTHTNTLCCSYCEVFSLFNLFNYALYSLCPARSLAAGPAAEIWMFLLSFNLRTSRHGEDPLLLFGPFFTLLFWCATTSQGCASPSSEHNQHRPGGVVVRLLLLFRHTRFLSLSTWSWIFTIRGSLDTSGALCRRFRTLPTAFDSLLGHDFGLCALAPRNTGDYFERLKI